MGYQEVAIRIRSDRHLNRLFGKINEKSDSFGIDIVRPLAIFRSLRKEGPLKKGAFYLICGGYERPAVRTVARKSIAIESILNTFSGSGDMENPLDSLFCNGKIEHIGFDFYLKACKALTIKNWTQLFAPMYFLTNKTIDERRRAEITPPASLED